MAHGDPIAYFLTITTYGTWLPGDQRGWVEYKQGWKLPDPIRELEAAAIMTASACLLDIREREMVELQLAETCRHRGWILHAKNCRSNHMHALIETYETSPKKVRASIKAWCTRRLKERFNPDRENWWADRGSIRWVFDENGLETVGVYIREAQDNQ